MTKDEAIEILNNWSPWQEIGDYDRFRDALKMAIQALEQTDKIEESNFSTEQYKADLQGAYDCGYNCGYADARNDIAESEDKE